MSKKCVAFSKSKLGLEKADNRKAFYAGWDAALAEREACAKDRLGSNGVVLEKHTPSDDGLITEIISE